VEGTLFLRDGLKDTRTGLLPLIKGLTPEEWRQSHDPLAREGFVNFSFYGSQYFGNVVGKRDLELTDCIRGILSLCHIRYLLLIGYQSTRRIPELPRAVQAFAGQRWRSQCKVGEVTPAVSRRLLESLFLDSRQLRRTRQEVLLQERTPVSIEVT